MIPLRQLLEQIWPAYSGMAAWQTVADLARFHRIQGSPGFRQAAELVQQRLILDGLATEILSYPANESVQYWTLQGFQEWRCDQATLHLVEPEKEAQELANFRACPISLIQRSISFQGEAEVILLEDGVNEADYEGLDVAGKIVLTRGDVHHVRELAIEERGAIGILFDGMRVVPPVRPEGDLADVRQYTSFWWTKGKPRYFGFVLTPRQGQTLRRLLKKAESPVRVRALVDSELYDGAMEVVSATIAGELEQEIIVVAHLCHPRPSANDNASGAAAALEAARVLQALITEGVLPRPKRTIRFVWLPEINGMYAYLAGREEELERLIAGVNLDMVGEDQNQTGGCWLIERPPDAAASFAPDLLARLRDELPLLKGMTDISPSHTGIGGWPLYRQAEVPFSGGSDHYVLSDPTVGVPTPLLIQWPDRFYHTSADTPDRTDPNSLARAGTLAAGYAYWLATAGGQEAAWLGYEMVARFKKHLVEKAQDSVTRAQAAEDAETLARILADLDRRLAYLLDRQQAALDTLQRLAPIECQVLDLKASAQQAAHQELTWAKGAIDVRAAALGLESLPEGAAVDLSDEEQQAAGLVPVRKIRGPVELNNHLPRLDEEVRQGWLKLLQARKGWGHHTLTLLALFWADGVRSVLEIADRVELESGQRDMELLLAYFRLLDKLGFVELRDQR